MKPLPPFVVEMLAALPPAGEGVHNWLFRIARHLHAHLSAIEIITLLEERTRDCGRNVSRREIEDAVKNSLSSAWKPSGKTTSTPRTGQPAPKKWPFGFEGSAPVAIHCWAPPCTWRLQCLSALRALRPGRAVDGGTGHPPRLQCLSALRALRPMGFNIEAVAEGVRSPVPFGFEGSAPFCEKEPYARQVIKGLQCLSALRALRPRQSQLRQLPTARSPVPFGFEGSAPEAYRDTPSLVSIVSPVPFGFEGSAPGAGRI